MGEEDNLGSSHVLAIRQMRIVVCDASDCSHVVDILNRYGFQSVVCVEPADLLESLSEMQGVSGVILSVDHSSPDTMMLLHQLRAQHPHIPVLTMGKIAHLRLLRKSVDLGAINYVVTPVDRELLKRKCVQAFCRPGSSAFITHEHTTI